MTFILCVGIGLIKGFLIGAGWWHSRSEKEINALKEKINILNKKLNT